MTTKESLIAKFIRFISTDIWRITENELSKSKKFLYRLIKIVIIAFRGFIQDKLSMRASALTYSILFAMIPLIALFIAIGKGFGVEDLIKDWLKEAFVAQKEILPTLLGFVDKYLGITQKGIFIGVGIVTLLISVTNFFMQAEDAFNSIWMVQKRRTIYKQLTTYFSALLIMPVLIVLSGGLKIYFDNLLMDNEFIKGIGFMLRFWMKMTPYFVSWILFVSMYKIMPNTKVKFSSALVAGIISGTAFQFFQNIYIAGQKYLSNYDVVYGGFAAIPLLLMWLQISGIIILLGAEISYASQNFKNYEFEVDTNTISNRYKNFIQLFLTYLIVKRFENGEDPYNSNELSSNYKLPIRLVNQTLDELIKSGIISEVILDSKHRHYQPSMDINLLSVGMIVEKIDTHGSELFLSNRNEVLDQFWTKIEELHQKELKLNSKILIKDL